MTRSLGRTSHSIMARLTSHSPASTPTRPASHVTSAIVTTAHRDSASLVTHPTILIRAPVALTAVSAIRLNSGAHNNSIMHAKPALRCSVRTPAPIALTAIRVAACRTRCRRIVMAAIAHRTVTPDAWVRHAKSVMTANAGRSRASIMTLRTSRCAASTVRSSAIHAIPRTSPPRSFLPIVTAVIRPETCMPAGWGVSVRTVTTWKAGAPMSASIMTSPTSRS